MYAKRRCMGFITGPIIVESSMKRKHWSGMELHYIKKNYGKHTAREIADMLDKTETAVFSQAQRLGLKSKLRYQTI